jgi:hypothetical protein
MSSCVVGNETRSNKDPNGVLIDIFREDREFGGIDQNTIKIDCHSHHHQISQ